MIINGFEHIPKENRKHILLLSDDLRLNSGVGTASRNFVTGTSHRYNWFQLGAAVNHPDIGKRIDVSVDINNQLGITDSQVYVQPHNGYGDPDILRHLLGEFKFDAILHFTDPRQWIWLYQMEHEVRQNIPIFFYHVWDNLPYPKYNKEYYKSCDLITCISKQTKNIVENVCPDWFEEDQVTYIPHGINPEEYFPITEEETGTMREVDNKGVKELKSDFEIMNNFKNDIFKNKQYDFIIFYNNRNIRRKNMGSTILSYKLFCDKLTKEEASRCAFLMHTQVVDPNGTDLYQVKTNICPDYDVVLHDARIPPQFLNYMYNFSDITINLASAEGFGLATAESLMAGIPILATVTGGMQDQMGFRDENGNLMTFNTEFGTNSIAKYTSCGEWAFPVFPAARNLVGSPPTPYIFDDHVDIDEVIDVLYNIYKLGKEERRRRGLLGRQFVLSDESGMTYTEMSKRFMTDMEVIWSDWKPRDTYKLITI